MTKRLIFLALLLLPIAAWSQGNTVIKTATGAPTGSCGVVQQYIDKSNGDFYTCNTSTNAWQLSASHAAICDSNGNCTISGNVVVSGTLTVGPAGPANGSAALGTLKWGGVVSGGAADAYTLGVSSTYTSYTAGDEFAFIPTASNATTTPTVNVNSIGTVTVTKCGGSAVAANDLKSGHQVKIIYNGTTFDELNPQTGCSASVNNSIIKKVGVGSPSSSTTFANLCGNLTFTAGTLSAGDNIEISGMVMMYGGTGTPVVYNIGMAVSDGAHGSPYYTVNSAAGSAGHTYYSIFIAHISVFDNTHLGLNFFYSDGAGNAMKTGVTGSAAGQIYFTGTDAAPSIDLSGSLASNDLTINVGGFLSAGTGTAQTLTCMGATAYVLKP